MVHALEEVRRVLRMGGTLVDMRPVVSHPYVEILSGENVALAGRMDDSADLEPTKASDDAVVVAIERGWIEEHEQDSFSFAYYWDTPEEMFNHIADRWPEANLPEEIYAKAEQLYESAGPGTRLRITFPMMIKVYRKKGEL